MPAAIPLGGVALVSFLGAALLARRPALDGALDAALAAADAGSTARVLVIAFANAVAERHFFRGALPIAVTGDHRPAVATVL
jgi:CAAX protease family protein